MNFRRTDHEGSRPLKIRTSLNSMIPFEWNLGSLLSLPHVEDLDSHQTRQPTDLQPRNPVKDPQRQRLPVSREGSKTMSDCECHTTIILHVDL